MKVYNPKTKQFEDDEIKQSGNNYNYITSNYGTGKQVYVPYAPSLSLIYRQNGFHLDWSAVTIPSKYNLSTKYAVFGVRNVPTATGYTQVREIIADNLTATTLNLSERIQAGTVDETFVQFGVYVMGDNSQVLNGKISNIINTTVLAKTTAYVHNGELYWNEQVAASEYLLSYTEENNEISTKYVTLYEPHWDG